MALLILALPLTACALAYGVFVPVYQSNDDIALEMIASGRGICAEPTPFLLFVNVLVGEALSWLYTNAAGLPWYRLFMIGLHLIAGLTLAGLAVARGVSAARLILAINFFLIFDLYFWVRPHFSITSAVAALAAVVLWIHCLDRGRCGVSAFLLFLALIAGSVLVRFEATVQMLLVAVPNLLLAAGRPTAVPSGPGLRRAVRLSAGPLACAAGIVVGAKVYNDHRYASTPGWQDFYEYNALRAEFTDYQRASYDETSKPLFDRAGWSENDFFMLRYWFFADEKRYSKQAFRTVLAGFPRVESSGSANVLAGMGSDLRTTPALQALVAALVVPFVFAARRQGGTTRLALAYGSVVLVCGLVIVARRRLPPWVYEPLLAYGPALALVLPAYQAPALSAAWPWRMGPIAILLGYFATTAARQLWLESETALVLNQRLKYAIRQLRPCPDQLYVLWGGMFPFEFILSAADLDEWRDFKMLGTGFTAHTPINRARLQEFRIGDVYAALWRQPDVLLVCHAKYAPALAAYVQEHYGVQLMPRKLGEVTLGNWRQYDGKHGHIVAYPRGFAVFRLAEKLPTGKSGRGS